MPQFRPDNSVVEVGTAVGAPAATLASTHAADMGSTDTTRVASCDGALR